MTSSSLSITTPSDPEATDLVEDLAEELESFAFERERVLVKLDIRSATLARRIAREMRVVLRGLPLATDDGGHDAVMATVGGLLEEAHRLLEGEAVAPSDAEEPQAKSGERLLAEIRGERSAASLRPTLGSLACVSDPTLRLPSVMGGLPSVIGDDGDEEMAQEETIARRVVWARSGNRILGG